MGYLPSCRDEHVLDIPFTHLPDHFFLSFSSFAAPVHSNEVKDDSSDFSVISRELTKSYTRNNFCKLITVNSKNGGRKTE